jgi:hypothetical protein
MEVEPDEAGPRSGRQDVDDRHRDERHFAAVYSYATSVVGNPYDDDRRIDGQHP